jgi:hypothetical protein
MDSNDCWLRRYSAAAMRPLAAVQILRNLSNVEAGSASAESKQEFCTNLSTEFVDVFSAAAHFEKWVSGNCRNTGWGAWWRRRTARPVF